MKNKAQAQTNIVPSPDDAASDAAVSGELVTRDELGRFLKGVSGNPVGRPQGSKNKATILREMLDEVALGEVAKEYVEVIEAMIREAKAGNVAAAKLIKEIADIAASEDQRKGGGKTVQVYIENFTQNVEER